MSLRSSLAWKRRQSGSGAEDVSRNVSIRYSFNLSIDDGGLVVPLRATAIGFIPGHRGIPTRVGTGKMRFRIQLMSSR